MRTDLMIGILGLLMSIFTSGCGVKGKPQLPLTAPPIGRGKPTLTGRNEKVSIEELNRKRDSDDSDSEPRHSDDAN